jgi:hypothetical protein
VANGEDASLEGLTLTGGAGYLTNSDSSYSCGSGCVGYHYYETWSGGGLYVSGSNATLTDLVITGNDLADYSVLVTGYDDTTTWSFGGGVCVTNGTVVGEGLTIDQNDAYQGGGVYVTESGAVDLFTSSVAQNTAETGAGFVLDGGSAGLTNALVVWNDAATSAGAAMVTDGTLTATNVTFDHNDAPTAGGLYVDTSGTATVVSCLLTHSDTGEGVKVTTGSVAISYSFVYGNAGGGYTGMTDPTGTRGMIASNPLYVDVTDNADWTDDDWSLASGSPAIDVGDPSAAMKDADGSVNDMGAFGGPAGSW